jgi:hypothetical protein
VAAKVAARLGRFPFLAEAPLGQIQGDFPTIFITSGDKEAKETAETKMIHHPRCRYFLPPPFAQMFRELLLRPFALDEERGEVLIAVAVHALLPGGGESRLVLSVIRPVRVCTVQTRRSERDVADDAIASVGVPRQAGRGG